MPPSAAPEWLRTGWILEISATPAPASCASIAARMPAQPAPTMRTSCWASTTSRRYRMRLRPGLANDAPAEPGGEALLRVAGCVDGLHLERVLAVCESRIGLRALAVLPRPPIELAPESDGREARSPEPEGRPVAARRTVRMALDPGVRLHG